jgi:hypothetical protein
MKLLGITKLRDERREEEAKELLTSFYTYHKSDFKSHNRSKIKNIYFLFTSEGYGNSPAASKRMASSLRSRWENIRHVQGRGM